MAGTTKVRGRAAKAHFSRCIQLRQHIFFIVEEKKRLALTIVPTDHLSLWFKNKLAILSLSGTDCRPSSHLQFLLQREEAETRKSLAPPSQEAAGHQSLRDVWDQFRIPVCSPKKYEAEGQRGPVKRVPHQLRQLGRGQSNSRDQTRQPKPHQEAKVEGRCQNPVPGLGHRSSKKT